MPRCSQPERVQSRRLQQPPRTCRSSSVFYRRAVVLADPMLATGGSLVRAVGVLLAAGVREDRIVVVNVVSAPEGLATLRRAHPDLRIVTGAVDAKLNEQRYIVPGLGDFGDRYYGTVNP